jgi:hypothetical protein
VTQISAALRAKVFKQGRSRCGYCLASEEYVYAVMEIDHLTPKSAGGTDGETNLWLSCPFCNRFKGLRTSGVDPETKETVGLFNPREQVWSEHFDLDGAFIVGRTVCGRATVETLRLNNSQAVRTRTNWIQVGWYPPKEEADDLP